MGTVVGAGAQKIGELSVKLAGAALVAREKGDEVEALFFAIKAAETLALAKALGWVPGPVVDAGKLADATPKEPHP